MLIVESRISGWAVGKGHRSCGYRSRRDQRGWASLVWALLVSGSARVGIARVGIARVAISAGISKARWCAGGRGRRGRGGQERSRLAGFKSAQLGWWLQDESVDVGLAV